MNERLAKEDENFNEKFDEYINRVIGNINKATDAYTTSIEENSKTYLSTETEILNKINEYGDAIVNILNDIYKNTGYNPNNPNGSSPSYVQYLEGQATYNADKSLPPIQGTHDAFMSGNGKPMTIAANSIYEL